MKNPTIYFVFLSKIFIFNILFIATFKVFKTIKGTFSENLRSPAQKMKKEIDF